MFQSACMLTTDTNTHRIDYWMIRFLLEHSVPLESRAEDTATRANSVTASSDQKIRDRHHPSPRGTQAATSAVAAPAYGKGASLTIS